MDAIKGNIYTILNGNKQFLIPVYQRYYSWEKDQCERLWADIVNMQKKGKESHFVGSIVNIAEKAMPTGVQRYMIIDGQQRITTMTLLLIALRDYALAHPDDKTVKAQQIENTLLKNEYEDGADRYKLLLTDTDREILIDLVERKPIAKDVVSRLLTNYQFFADQVEKQELLPAEIYEAVGKLQIVNITLERDKDDAQAIFESLNSTGKELSESDLIRNHVLMGLEPQEQRHVYEHFWRPIELLFEYEKQDQIMDRFFRDYLTMKLGRIPKQNLVYEEFKAYHLNCEFATVSELCEDLLTYARYYTNMIFRRSENGTLRALYTDISELRMEVAYPFLLKVHNDRVQGIISEEQLAEILALCISYVFRRSVCDIPTNSLNKTFATMKNEIRPDDYMNSIKAFFILRDDYKVFPNDERFGIALKTKDVYHMRQRNYLLSRLENFGNKAPIVIENYTIEHIMPQNPNLGDAWRRGLGDDWKEVQKQYLHTIGNLTLTAYNSEMSDWPFQEKMEMEGGFKESALRLNAYVVKQSEWNERTIQERANQLIAKAEEIWTYPKLTPSELAPYQIEDKPAQRYSLDSYDFNMVNRTLFDMLDKRIMNLSPDVTREFKKLYIAYKLDTNFVDIVVQKQRLRISLNMKFSEIYDPNSMCHDVTGLGRWGNGDVEIYFEHTTDIDDVMELVEQSYRSQADEG
ncbi:MAG: GmrSD restriction endonuclease domain-containing protein [Planifilum sp.]|jgi:uncharacterized protein with ParB-like and HNH nuclease domain/predicted transport protein